MLFFGEDAGTREKHISPEFHGLTFNPQLAVQGIRLKKYYKQNTG